MATPADPFEHYTQVTGREATGDARRFIEHTGRVPSPGELAEFLNSPEAIREDLISGAEGLFLGNPPSPFTGQRVAPFSNDQRNAFGNVRDFVGQISGPLLDTSRLSREALNEQLASYDPSQQAALTDAARGRLTNILSPDFLSPDTNPYLEQYLQLANDEVTRNFNENVVPQMFVNRISNNTFGSSRDTDVSRVLASDRLNEDINRFTFGLLQDQYNRGVGQQLKAAGLTPGFQGLELNEASQLLNIGGTANSQYLGGQNALLEVGGMQQSLEQAQIDGEMAEFYEREYGPYWAFNQYASIVSGVPFEGQVIQPQGMQRPSDASAAVGGALSGAAIGAQVGSMVPGIGTGIGALGGALLGGLGGLL